MYPFESSTFCKGVLWASVEEWWKVEQAFTYSYSKSAPQYCILVQGGHKKSFREEIMGYG